MAYEIVKRLKGLGDFERLNVMEKSVSKRERKNGKRHNVFQPSFDAKLCLSESFTLAKLNYIHCNPVKGKWELAEDFLSIHTPLQGFMKIENMTTELYEVILTSSLIEHRRVPRGDSASGKTNCPQKKLLPSSLILPIKPKSKSHFPLKLTV